MSDRTQSARDAYQFLAANEGQLVTYQEISDATGGVWALHTVGNYRSKKWKNLLVRDGNRYQVGGVSLMTEDEFVALQSQVREAIIDPQRKVIDAAIAAGDGQTVEFKAAIPKSAADLATEVAAFATSGSGTILVGVTDDGRVVGYTDGPERLEGIVHNVAPSPTVNVAIVPYKGKTVGLVRVARGTEPLYYANDRPYLRQGTLSRPCTPTEVRERFEHYFRRRGAAEHGSVAFGPNALTAEVSVIGMDLTRTVWGFSPTNNVSGSIVNRNTIVFSRRSLRDPATVSYWTVEL